MNEGNERSLPPLETRDTRSRRSAGKILLILFILGAALAAAVWYGRPYLERHNDLFGKIPGLEESLNSAGQRIDAAEGKLREWAKDRETLREKVAGLDEKLQSGLQTARAQARQAADQVYARWRAETHERDARWNARLERLEANQESGRVRMARLEAEVDALQRDVNRRLAEAREDAVRDGNDLRRHLTTLDRQVEHGRQDLSTLSRQVERRRIDFEVSRNEYRELAPGIFLKLTGLNPAHRRVDGWMWVLPDRRTVWIRHHGAQQPVRFYSKSDQRAHELVITHVSRDSAVGYLLLPASSAGENQRAYAADRPGSE